MSKDFREHNSSVLLCKANIFIRCLKLITKIKNAVLLSVKRTEKGVIRDFVSGWISNYALNNYGMEHNSDSSDNHSIQSLKCPVFLYITNIVELTI